MDNLRRVLDGVGLGFGSVVCVRIYLTDFERDYAAMNALYATFFEAGRLPARTTVGVTALARGGIVEIDMIAAPGGVPVTAAIEIPARRGKAAFVAEGQLVTVINTHGEQVVDTWAFSRHDLGEFMSMEHSRAPHAPSRPAPGRRAADQ